MFQCGVTTWRCTVTEPNQPEKTERSLAATQGSLIPALAVLGAGIGAAIGTAIGELGTGIWIGGAIGVGLAMVISFFMSR